MVRRREEIRQRRMEKKKSKNRQKEKQPSDKTGSQHQLTAKETKKQFDKKYHELTRSYSLNEKDKRKSKRKSKQFSCFDDSDIENLESRQRRFKNDLNKRNYEDGDVSAFYKLQNLLDHQKRQINTQMKSMNKNEWLHHLRQHSTTYFIEDVRSSVDGPGKTLRSEDECIFSKQGGARIGTNADKSLKKQQETVSDCTEIDNDSGIPYESSLDTISRDEVSLQLDEISLQPDEVNLQPNEESLRTASTNIPCENPGFGLNYSGYQQENASLKHGIINFHENDTNHQHEVANLPEACIDSNAESTPSHKDTSLDSAFVDDKEENLNATAGIHFTGESRNSELIAEYDALVKKTLQTIDGLSLKELMIAELEFQLDSLLEDDRDCDDGEFEMEELEIVAELKQIHEYVKAVTTLCQYQRREHDKLSNELNYVNQFIKSRKLKLNALERKLHQVERSTVPRHLRSSNYRRPQIVIIEEDSAHIHDTPNRTECSENEATDMDKSFVLSENEAVTLV
eukprot:gene17929-19716_t